MNLSDWVEFGRSLLQALIYSLLIGGGLWKGLEAVGKVIDAVSNAFKLRAEASITRRRLEDDQIKSGYYAALEMLKQQAIRLESLNAEILALEIKCTDRENGFREQIDELFEKIKILEQENSQTEIKYQNLKAENDILIGKIEDLKNINSQLRKRLRKLEQGDPAEEVQ